MTDTESAASFAEPQLDAPLPVGSENRARRGQAARSVGRHLAATASQQAGARRPGHHHRVRVRRRAQIFAGVTGIHGGYLAPYDPNAVDYSIAKSPPSLAHPFGTDYIGRDVFSRVLVASRISLWSA